MSNRLISLLSLLAATLLAQAQPQTVTGPDGRLRVDFDVKDGRPVYSVTYDGRQMLDESPLGFVADAGDFTANLSLVDAWQSRYTDDYTLDRSKRSAVHYEANQLSVRLANQRRHQFTILFRVSNNDVAFCYELPWWDGFKNGRKMSVRVMREATGFDLPHETTTFLSPQSDAMIGWKSTKPSYEEEYLLDEPMTTRSRYGKGYTFPCLFHAPSGWVLISETGVSSQYCGSHLSDFNAETGYTVAFPQPGEFAGLGSHHAGIALEAAGHQHEAGRPDLLVERQHPKEQETGNQHQGAPGIHLAQVLGHQQFSHHKANERMGHGGKGGENALRLDDGAPAVHVRLTKEGAVHLVQDVVGTLRVAVSKQKQGAIGPQQRRHYPAQPLVVHRAHDQGRYPVAQRQPLQHAQGTHPAEGDAAVPDTTACPVEQEAYAKQQHKALENLPGQLETAPGQTQVHGNAHYEHKGGKDKISGREAVPRGMVQRRIRRSARVVHHQHERHGHAAKDIYRFYSLVHRDKDTNNLQKMLHRGIHRCPFV